MASPPVEADVAIIGGGIAGLWLLARLQSAGYGALLLEAEGLGAGQSLASQGIIHGGLKYALDMALGSASAALADMPARWRACLKGQGDVDLSAARLNAEHQLFWARNSLLDRITGFFGAKGMRGSVNALPRADWPAMLQSDAVGAVYKLDEPVLDAPALIEALARPRLNAIKRIAPAWRIERDAAGGIAALIVTDPLGLERSIRAKRFIFTAGAGNEAALAMLGLDAARAQRRPLHMLAIKGLPAPLYAHCFDQSDKPRVTITAHKAADGAWVWYVGGDLAEKGAGMDEAALIQAARAEFDALLPGLHLEGCGFAGFRVDRAEAATQSGAKPDGPEIIAAGNALIAWPTKLALAPALSDRLRPLLPPPSVAALDPMPEWAPPPFALPPWETLTWQH